MNTRLLSKEESIPYDLLLLADEELQAIERYIHHCDLYVVEQIDKTIGVYALYPIDDHTIEIKAIAVVESSQNQGIGKLMLKDAALRAVQKGFKELIIGTPSTAAKQLAIYRKAGFEDYAIKRDFFITYYTAPIFEDGVQLRDMTILKKSLSSRQRQESRKKETFPVE